MFIFDCSPRNRILGHGKHRQDETVGQGETVIQDETVRQDETLGQGETVRKDEPVFKRYVL